MIKWNKIITMIWAAIFIIFAVYILDSGELYYKGVHISGMQAYFLGIVNFILGSAIFLSIFK